MKTDFWGPSAWRFLHAVTFSYPDEPSPQHKAAALELFRSLKFLLPCGNCCTHYCGEFEKHKIEPHLESKSALTKWLIDLHNRVNARLGKRTYSYSEVQLVYDAEQLTCDIEAPCGLEKEKPIPSPSSSSKAHVIAIATLLLIALVFLFWICK